MFTNKTINWSFDIKVVLPYLENHPVYTSNASLATFHVIPHRYEFDDHFDFPHLLGWVRDTYAPWNNSANVFLFFNFCDLLRDCQHLHAPLDTLPDEFNPASHKRRYILVQWNGLADGADSGQGFCNNCMQSGRDIQMPTAEMTCGIKCNSYSVDFKKTKLMYVWPKKGVQSMLTSMQYVGSWEPRRYVVTYTGRVPPDRAIDDDISGRFWFASLYLNRSDWFVRSTYNYVTNTHSPVDTPIIELMRNSTFCYSPLGGQGGDTDRYIPALFAGCIPIMLKNVRAYGLLHRMIQPYEDLIQWDKIAVLIDYDDIPRLPELLSRVNVKSKRAHFVFFWHRLLYTTYYGAYFGETGRNDGLETFVKILKTRSRFI